MGSSSLPLELIDMILAYHRYDAETLKACSTVSSLWMASSRPLLFHTLNFSAEAAGVDAFKTTSSVTERLNDLADFLKQASHLRCLVKEFRLRQSSTHRYGQMPCPVPQVIDLELLLTLLSKLPALRTLSLVGICCNGIEPPPNVTCKSLTKIVLVGMAHFSTEPDHLSRIMRHFPNVSDFEVLYCNSNIRWDSKQVADVRPSGIRLRSLTATYAWPLPFWISLPNASFETLESLDIRLPWRIRIGPADIREMGRLLHSAGESLRHLYVDIDAEDTDIPEVGESPHGLKSSTYR